MDPSIENARKMIAGWRYFARAWSEAKNGDAEERCLRAFDRLMDESFAGEGLSVWRFKEPKDPVPGRVTRWIVVAIGDEPVIEKAMVLPEMAKGEKERLSPEFLNSLLDRRLAQMVEASRTGALRSHTHFEQGAEMDRSGRLHPR